MRRIINIKKKLEELRNLDKGFSVFGSSRHKYQLKPSLTEQEIIRIESEHEITLSKEYRAILKHLGNGGAGCGYGLESLSFNNINPPYIGSKELLRNWDDPEKIDFDMVDTDEVSGYVKLFDYGCGMETCLIVKGAETAGMIYFDCDGHFEKIKNNTILDSLENWLNHNLDILKRIEKKLDQLPLQEVIDSEWELDNFSIKEMILSLIDAQPLEGGHSGHELNAHLEKEYEKWKHAKDSAPKKRWKFL